MADPNSLKNDMHTATGASQLYSLRGQADAFINSNSGHLPYFLNHIYREYNKGIIYRFNATGALVPYNGGLTPTGYSP